MFICMVSLASKLSWASLTSSSSCEMISRASTSAAVVEGIVVGMRGGIKRGNLPVFSWNGEKPVEEFTVFMIAKWIWGSLDSQPF